ncbi:MAG: aldehyde dehydrogenase family protein [Halobacteriovoraceae bacterium]|nr:aldehyde dehydrogenase family protein [Halobacteriovoraceae bacterium]
MAKKNKKTQKNKSKKTQPKKGFHFEYDEALESTAVVKLKKKYGLFIGGEFKASKSGKTFKTENPATGEKLAELALADKKDVDSAVQAAKKAFKAWSELSGKERGKYLFRIARLIQERSREFAVLETLDGGKPIKESRDVDIPLAANHFFYYAGWADKLDYAFPGKKIKPVGVCGQIIPWNFPLLMAAWKLAPALAAGNTVVLKPAEQTSLTALLLAEVIQEAELPKGVVNIITGEGKTGAALVDHPDVKKIAFTGSTDIGKTIAKAIAGSDKKLTLELGGKSANIIFEDAAIDQAVEGIVNGIFFNQGHVCCAGSRVLVQESIKDEVIAKLKKRMSTLRVGNPLDKNTDVGAINSKEQLEKINSLVAIGKKEGGRFHEVDCALPKKGYYCKPCFFEGQTPASTLSRVEVFGPVLSIMTFRTPDEAVKIANDSNYGLAAGIWSEKSSKIHKIASELKAGVIWGNTYNKFDPAAPFGGYKESGFGREGGLHGLYPYVEVR